MKRILIFIGLKIIEIVKTLLIGVSVALIMSTAVGIGYIFSHYILGIDRGVWCFFWALIFFCASFGIWANWSVIRKWIKSNWYEAGEIEKKWSKK